MKILIGYDGSESANIAIAEAGSLLSETHAEAIVLSVWEPVLVGALHAARFGAPMSLIATAAPVVDDHLKQQAREFAEHGTELAHEVGFDATPQWAADDRDVASAILGEASNAEVELIVLGAHGLAGIRAFLGSVSNHVVQHSSCPVLVIPQARHSG